MRIFKRALGFILANLLAAGFMSFLLTEPSSLDILLHEIHADPEFDTVILGQSHGQTGYNPFVLSDELDCKAINLSKPLMTVTDFYYLLQEANRNSTIKTVILDIDYTYWQGSDDLHNGDDTVMFHHSGGKVKFRYLRDLLLDADYNQTFFDYALNKDTFLDIPGTVKTKLDPRYIRKEDGAVDIINQNLGRGRHYTYLGRGFRSGQPVEVARSHSEVWFDTGWLNDAAFLSLEKIADYCRREGIALICVTSAYPPYRVHLENHDEVHDYFAEICRNLDLPFYDMNYAKTEYLPRTNEMFMDYDGHMGGDIADRQTALLAEIIRSQDPDRYFETDYSALKASLPQ